MTCIEKLRELYPVFSEEDVDNYIFDYCPKTDGIADEPEWCGVNNANLDTCLACWDREVPEEKPITEEEKVRAQVFLNEYLRETCEG